MFALSARQESILAFLRSHLVAKGYPPTVREIANQFGIASPNGVMCHLRALEKKGAIQRDRNRARAIVLTLSV